jgi:hypothetical protein
MFSQLSLIQYKILGLKKKENSLSYLQFVSVLWKKKSFYGGVWVEKKTFINTLNKEIIKPITK